MVMQERDGQAEQRNIPLFERYKPRVDSYTQQFLTEHGGLAEPMIAYHLGYKDAKGAHVSDKSGGKGIRPTLCLLTVDAGGGDWEVAVPAAAALELFHNFTLIHDDIQDNDKTRHGKPTVWAITGVGQGINIGDSAAYISTKSLLELSANGVPGDKIVQAVKRLTDTGIAVIDGQIRDLGFEGRTDVGIEEYLEMISRKTGKLIEASVMIGADLAGMDDYTKKQLEKYSQILGRAFQISDDLLGVWGDEAKTGKPVGSDIRRRKQSYPIALAFSTADSRQLRLLRSIYSQPTEELDEEDVLKVKAIFEEMSIQPQTQAYLTSLHADATDTLSLVDLGWAQNDYKSLIDSLIFREK